MAQLNQKEKFRFFSGWLLLNILVIPVSYLVSLIVVLIFTGVFGIPETEWGTHLEQTIIQVAGGATLAFGTGFYQKKQLKRLFNANSSWIITLVAGFVAAEIIAGLVTWQLNLNRMQLRIIELQVFPEALIFAGAGLITGILQWFLLKKHFTNSVFWIVASMLGWGIQILAMANVYLMPDLRYAPGLFIITELVAFAVGAALYGAITGGALIWIMKARA